MVEPIVLIHLPLHDGVVQGSQISAKDRFSPGKLSRPLSSAAPSRRWGSPRGSPLQLSTACCSGSATSPAGRH